MKVSRMNEDHFHVKRFEIHVLRLYHFYLLGGKVLQIFKMVSLSIICAIKNELLVPAEAGYLKKNTKNTQSVSNRLLLCSYQVLSFYCDKHI